MADASRPAGFSTRRNPYLGGPVVSVKRPLVTLKRLWTWFLPQHKVLLAVFLLVLGSILWGLTVPLLIGKTIDAIVHGTQGMVGWLLLGYLADAGLSASQGWLMAGASQKIVAELRQSLFSKLQFLPLVVFDTRPHGDLMSRFINDLDNVSSAVAQSSAQLLSSSLSIVGSLVLMLVLSPILTVAALLSVPLVLILTRTITKRTRILFQEQQRNLGAVNAQVEETITGFDLVKAFHQEEQMIDEFDKSNARLVDVAVRAQTWAGLAMPLTNVIGNLSFVAVGVLGGWLAFHGAVTVGLIAAFLGYSRQFVRPLNDVANTWNSLQAALAGAERVFEIMDEKEEPADLPQAKVWSQPNGKVEFVDVSFAYRRDTPVLKNVSFVVPAGETLALVGPTGAGKTTIVNLLTRFYEPTAGNILLDGLDITSYTRSSLRRAFGVVLQDTFLFSGTVRDNLKYGHPEASDEAMVRSAVLANADGLIRRLPQGYDTLLTEGGENLSQGERQLLAIARVMLSDPPMLILDEATSNVDTRTERHIQEAMLALRKNRTSFVIAHRLSTIREAHTILVVDEGRIVEAGNHESLLARDDGVYKRLFQAQYGQP
jgi:ATP-binding cassette subfamily B protein